MSAPRGRDGFAQNTSTPHSKQFLAVSKNLTTLDTLRGQLDVTKVDVSHNHIEDGTLLKKCKKLSWLNLNKNKIVSINFVSTMKNLTVLNLSNNLIEDMSPVSSLSGLKALILAHNHISNVQGLDGLANLNTLVLSHNEVEFVDVSCLSQLIKLQLSHNKIAVFPDVKFNAELKNLSLNGNLLTAVPEDHLGENDLEMIDLGKNNIKKLKYIKTIASISTLKQLNLKGNPLCEGEKYSENVIEMFPKLKTLDSQPVSKLKQISEDSAKDQTSPIKKKHHNTDEPDSDVAEADVKPAKRRKSHSVKPNPPEHHQITEESIVKTSKSSKTKDVRKSAPSKKSDSGVVKIKEVKRDKRRKKSGDELFNAFQTDIGTGSSSCW